MLPTLLYLTSFTSFLSVAVAHTAYANDFIDPGFFLNKTYGANTNQAQKAVISWADSLASKGPWSVTSKMITPPSGDKHDYMSWAPYWWPNCSNVGNKTALTPEQIWAECNYANRDGQFNPDVRQVNDVGNFQDMSEAVFYNAIAWTFPSSNKTAYESNVVNFVRTWFLNADTKMNPNLNYGQMQRGPEGQTGSHTGILDLKGMAKIATGLLILRKGGSTLWTTDLDNQFIAWSKQYITWLETAEIAVDEGQSTNNHGTFYYDQLAALKLIVNDLAGAKNVTSFYFDTIFKGQIAANGDQPLESARTRPYHYRAYNLAGMITNARIASYVNPTSKPWNLTSSAGTTIKSALDYAITVSPGNESTYAAELYPNVAAVASVYGDAGGKYLSFLKSADTNLLQQPYLLWNQPFYADANAGSDPASSKTTTSKLGTATGNSNAVKSSSEALVPWGPMMVTWTLSGAISLFASLL